MKWFQGVIDDKFDKKKMGMLFIDFFFTRMIQTYILVQGWSFGNHTSYTPSKARISVDPRRKESNITNKKFDPTISLVGQ